MTCFSGVRGQQRRKRSVLDFKTGICAMVGSFLVMEICKSEFFYIFKLGKWYLSNRIRRLE